MISLAARRQRNMTIVLGAGAVLWLLFEVAATGLRSTSLLTGWLLLVLVLFLALYNVRKKLPFLPLGTSAAWLQAHVYAGALSMFVFAYHVGFGIPNGGLEILLGLVYAVVAASGVVGLFMTRTFPVRLTTRGETILFERIPALRAQLRDEVEELVIRSVEEANSKTIMHFYTDHLRTYFSGPRHFLQHLLESRRAVRQLLDDLAALERYANDKERELLHEIRERVRLKSNLDYHYSLQSVLKGWLFVHIPLTYSLLVVALLHVIFVHAFAAGAS